MHSVAPYAMRCFDRNLKVGKHNGYHNLSNIKSENLYDLILGFIQSHSTNYSKAENGNQVYRFSNLNLEPDNIFCWIEIGDYGTENDIIDINTGEISFQKTQDNALINKFYVHFHIPKNKTTALMFVHNYKYGGAKSLFESEFRPFFKTQTDLVLQLFPFAHKKAIVAWQNANVKTIKVLGYDRPSDKSDPAEALRTLANGNETEFQIKAPRNGILGKLSEYLDRTNQKHQLIQDLSEETSGIKVEVEMNGSYRTFSVYSPRNSGRASYEIELDNDVEIEKGMPDFDSIKDWVKKLIEDFKIMMA